MAGIIGGAGVLTAIVPGSLMLMCAGTLIAENIYRPLAGHVSDQKVQTVARVFVWIVAAVTFIFSIHSNAAIVTLLLMGYNFVSQFFPNGGFVALCQKCSVQSWRILWYPRGCGIGGLFHPAKQSLLWGVNTGFWALLVNFVVVLAVSAVARGVKTEQSVTA